jgi:hypothetical protein
MEGVSRILIEGIGRFSSDGPMSFNYLRSNYSTEESGTGVQVKVGLDGTMDYHL